MSASVASSAVGLLDRPFSPQSIHQHAHDADWSDDMEIDRSSRERSKGYSASKSEVKTNQANQGATSVTMVKSEEDSKPLEGIQNKQEPTSVEPEDRATEDSSVKTQEVKLEVNNDRNDAIGGLLAALATTTSNESAPSQQARRQSTPAQPADSPISVLSQVHGEFPEVPIEQEGAPGASNNARLPSIQPNITTNNHSSFPNAAPAHDFSNLPPVHFPDASQISNIPDTLPFDQEAFPAFDMSMAVDPPPQTPIRHAAQRPNITAFARLEFGDGSFYLTTFQCELGRDQNALQDAVKRERQRIAEEEELAKNQTQSSSGRASQPSNVVRTVESQVERSVISEMGGFVGIDDRPVEAYGDKKSARGNQSHSSQQSESSIVRPSEVLHDPSLAPFDYKSRVTWDHNPSDAVKDTEDDEPAAPITADHMPDPHSCPLIPIHPTMDTEESEIDTLKAISRRHLKIYWNEDDSSFHLQILGRNGAFLDDVHHRYQEDLQLYHGATIQVSAVQFKFQLPSEIGRLSSSSIGSEEPSEPSPTGAARLIENGQPVKLKLKLNADGNTSQVVGSNGELKRRGPGRPPKNGVMSQREMKEREKAEKEAKARAINGGPTPPPFVRTQSKSQSQPPKPDPAAQEAPKPEKRKYTKRKREDGDEDEVLPSIEDGDDNAQPPENSTAQPTSKRVKSYSPPYKPREECTQEDLARPPHNYAVLLYMVLSETGEITLKRVYKEMQSRWPFFRYMVDSDGWTSSVRHNLNQEVGKLFERGRKEGKGFTWLPKPNAMEEYQNQKNKRSTAPSAAKPRPPPQRPNYPPSQGQQLSWQTNGPAPQTNRPGYQPPWPVQQNAGAQPGMLPTAASAVPQQNAQHPPSGVPQYDPNTPPDPNLPAHLLYLNFDKPAPSHMPVTWYGLAVVCRFEQSMFNAIKGDETTKGKWSKIFRSTKQRCLNGHEGSLLEDGETGEEKTIMGHMNNFVQQYKNPDFKGFGSVKLPDHVMGIGSVVPMPNAAPPAPSAQPAPNAPNLSTTYTAPRQPANTLDSPPDQPQSTAALAQGAPFTAHAGPPRADSHSHPNNTASSVVPVQSSTPAPQAPSQAPPTVPAPLNTTPIPSAPMTQSVRQTSIDTAVSPQIPTNAPAHSPATQQPATTAAGSAFPVGQTAASSTAASASAPAARSPVPAQPTQQPRQSPAASPAPVQPASTTTLALLSSTASTVVNVPASALIPAPRQPPAQASTQSAAPVTSATPSSPQAATPATRSTTNVQANAATLEQVPTSTASPEPTSQSQPDQAKNAPQTQAQPPAGNEAGYDTQKLARPSPTPAVNPTQT